MIPENANDEIPIDARVVVHKEVPEATHGDERLVQGQISRSGFTATFNVRSFTGSEKRSPPQGTHAPPQKEQFALLR